MDHMLKINHMHATQEHRPQNPSISTQKFI
jgi:hypothetical protein